MRHTIKNVFLAALLLGFACGTVPSVPTADAAEQVQAQAQAQPAQAAVVKSKKGDILKIYSFLDGSICVEMPDGYVLTGDDAMAALAEAGITLDVAADGAMNISGDVVEAPHAATPAEAAAANAAAAKAAAANAPALPANITSGSGRMEVDTFGGTFGSGAIPAPVSK